MVDAGVGLNAACTGRSGSEYASVLSKCVLLWLSADIPGGVQGGGIYNYGTLTITASTLSGNSAVR